MSYISLLREHQVLNKFIAWFEKDSPNFITKFGNIKNFYDKDADEFQIEEIQDAYEFFKQGDEPNTLYYLWGG